SDGEILGEEFNRVDVVAMDPADAGGGEENRVGPGLADPPFRRLLFREIDLCMRGRENFAAFACKTARDGGARQPGMAGDGDALSAQVKKNGWRHYLRPRPCPCPCPCRIWPRREVPCGLPRPFRPPGH